MDKRDKNRRLVNFRILGYYLWDNIKTLICLAVVFAAMSIMLMLYGFPVNALLYSFAIALFPILSMGIFSFYRYRRKYIELSKMRDSIVQAVSAVEPKGSKIERELSRIIGLMSKEKLHAERESRKKYSDMIDYYTMWVHQIKTPISAMRLLLQAEETSRSREMNQELFKIEQYVEMVLGYLRLESMNSDLELKKCSINKIVRNAVKKYRSAFIFGKISLELEEFENEVITDEKWLLFVIEQILSNALKYTKKGSIKIYMDQSDNLYISDTGIGISEEDLPRIFERGFTGYNGRVEKSSTGLGLYLCRRIMGNLGHEISISSNLDMGTVVRLALKRQDFSAY